MSEEIAWAAEIVRQRARIAQLEAIARTLEAQRDAAEADAASLAEAARRYKAETEMKAPFRDPDLRLWAREHLEALLKVEHPGAALLAEHESQLGTACAEIARLEEQLRQAGRMEGDSHADIRTTDGSNDRSVARRN